MNWLYRLNTWVRNRLRDWLDVPTEQEIREWSVDAVRQMYVFWERRIQEESKQVEERKKAVAKLEDEMARMAAQTTLAVEKVLTQIQLAERNWQAVVESQEEDDEEVEDKPCW